MMHNLIHLIFISYCIDLVIICPDKLSHIIYTEMDAHRRISPSTPGRNYASCRCAAWRPPVAKAPTPGASRRACSKRNASVSLSNLPPQAQAPAQAQAPVQAKLLNPKMAPQLKLTYFNGAGRAEIARLVFHYGGVAFEDHRIDFAQFGELKPSLPLGQVPILEVDGVVYTQSIAIARYAAKLAGVYPTDPLEALRADMIADTFGDLGQPLSDIRFREKDEAVKAEKSKVFLEETAPKALKVIEGLVQGKFVLGDSASLADFLVFDSIVNKIKATFPDFDVNAYPKLAAVVANVQALPAIAAYLDKKN